MHPPHLLTGTYSFEGVQLGFAGAEMVAGSSSSLPAHWRPLVHGEWRLLWIGPGEELQLLLGLVQVWVSHAAPQPGLLPLFPHLPATCPSGCSWGHTLPCGAGPEEFTLGLSAFFMARYLSVRNFHDCPCLCPSSAAPCMAMKHPSLLLFSCTREL